ncbi:MAG: hypothetical protein ABW098_02085 [Candidatus Thiodiazotropha sp.]
MEKGHWFKVSSERQEEREGVDSERLRKDRGRRTEAEDRREGWDERNGGVERKRAGKTCRETEIEKVVKRGEETHRREGGDRQRSLGVCLVPIHSG